MFVALPVCLVLLSSTVWAQEETENELFKDVPMIKSEAEMFELAKFATKEWDHFVKTATWREIPGEPRDPVSGVLVKQSSFTDRHGEKHLVQRGEVDVDYPPQLFYYEVGLKLEVAPKWSSFFGVVDMLKNYKNTTGILYAKATPPGGVEMPLRDALLLFTVSRTMENKFPAYQIIFTSVDTPNAPRDPNPGVDRLLIRYCVIRAYRLPDVKKTRLTWSMTWDINMPALPKNIAHLYERFYAIEFLESMLKWVEPSCAKYRLLCHGWGKKFRRRGGNRLASKP